MTTLVATETETKTREFLAGVCTAEDFEAWIVSVVDGITVQSERDALWEIRLLLTEYGEGLRPIEDAQARGTQLLQNIAATTSLSDSDNKNDTFSLRQTSWVDR